MLLNTEATDLSTLYGTIVQTSATIVAIIGGLITAASLQMSTERSSLIARMAEREQELEVLKKEAQRIRTESYQLQAVFLLTKRIHEILALDVLLSPELAQRHFDAMYIPSEVFVGEWNKFTRMIALRKSSLEQSLRLHAPGNLGFTDWVTHNPSVSVSHEESWLMEKLYDYLCGRPSHDSAQLNPDDERDHVSELAQKANQLSDLELRRVITQVELNQLRSRMKTPFELQQLIPGIAISVVFTIAGIFVPLVFLAIGPSANTTTHAVWVLALFFISISLSLGYITLVLKQGSK